MCIEGNGNFQIVRQALAQVLARRPVTKEFSRGIAARDTTFGLFPPPICSRGSIPGVCDDLEKPDALLRVDIQAKTVLPAALEKRTPFHLLRQPASEFCNRTSPLKRVERCCGPVGPQDT